MDRNAPEYWISALALKEHPEGGLFAESYRAGETIPGEALPSRYGAARSFSTAIYYMLRTGEFSAFHRIQSDEIWHFYFGGPLDLYVARDGAIDKLRIGNDPSHGQRLQCCIPAGTWFAAEPAAGSAFSLLGCTVSPGFDFADFELASYARLSAELSEHSALVRRFTRG